MDGPVPKRIGVPSDRQPLLVPFTQLTVARALGAQWDTALRIWSVPSDQAHTVSRSLLPLRDRPGLAPPYIRINLIPQTSWGCNVRALMSKDEWRAFIRTEVYSSTNSLCLVCGGRGPAWPVEADEVWHFDDAAGVQRLHAIVPLCPCCHEVRSAGFATARGRGRQAAEHLAWVERIPLRDAIRRIDEALEKWQARSRRQWTIDLSHMEQRYGIRLEPNEEAMRKANTALVREAEARRGRGNGNAAPAGKRPSIGMTGQGRGSHPSDGERLC